MQRDKSRVRCDRWGRIRSTPTLLASTVVTIGFNVAMYAYGFMSCRPGGHMWNTISGYEGGGMINMTGTWLAKPLGALDHPWKDLGNRTCGGTVLGQRPAPEIDSWVCVPTQDVRAEDSYSTWKRSLPSMGALMLLFLICGWCAELGSLQPGRLRLRVVFGVVVIFISFGLLGTVLVALMGLTVMAIPRISALSSGSALAVIWVLAVVYMNSITYFLGDHDHKVPGWNYNQGVKSWSKLEQIVCGDALFENKPNSQVCYLSRPFLISGLAPWFVFRFVALKFISLATDTLWSSRGRPVRDGLESKSDLVQRTEQHLVPSPPENDEETANTNLSQMAFVDYYSMTYYVAYLGYPPTFFAGPILSFNAFVSQLEKPILSYTAGMAPDNEQAKKARHSVIYYGIRVFILMAFLEVFSAYWWYSRKLNELTCTSKDQYSGCLFDDLSVWELYIGMHVVLHFTWLSLMIIWRFGRLVALADGIDSFENMLGCVSFNYTFTEFWRIWHASMNEFMLRYLYFPLGGKHRTWLAVPVVFAFVAYWHERTGFGTQPAWYAWASLNAIGVIINKSMDDILSRYRKTGRCPPGGPARWLVEIERTRVSDRPSRWIAQIIFFFGKGLGPVALILANVPAICLTNSIHFYRSLLLRGWHSAALVFTLVITFACNAHVVDALRAAKPPNEGRALRAMGGYDSPVAGG